MATAKSIKYNVGGVALDRPFKIRRLGHFGFNASNLEASRRFYFDLLGFFITEPAGAGFFGRHAGDHHSFALFDKKKFNERQYAGQNANHVRPVPMRHGTANPPNEPQLPDYQLVSSDIEKGINVLDGRRYVSSMPLKYSVDGVLLPQPFKITRVGPVNLFVDDYESSKQWYEQIAGFTLTEEVEWQNERCAFLRCDNEHHSLALFPKSWRKKSGLSETTSNMSFGLQLANYRQLKGAVSFLRENGVRVETDIIPPELHPGIDYAAYAFDPDGHCLELYYYMEQLGWDGRPRPKELRRKVDPNNWPETLDPLSDTYTGEPFIGPWA